MVTVRNLDELKKAKKEGEHEIIVQGELAAKLKKASKIAKLSKWTIVALAGVIGVSAMTVPVTGGLSMGAAASAAALTGLEIASIITASSIGIALILAIFKDYEEVGYSEEGGFILRKKQKKK